ncbi:MAG: hypothetical protein FDX30_06980 [Chlorobium sp.]|nr:MAG: hypothetical protein FDX30_06980 [Chlorobium sp.]
MPIDYFHQQPEQAPIMKHYELLILMQAAMAGCSTSCKGSINGSNIPEPSKNGNNLVSYTTASQSHAVINK